MRTSFRFIVPYQSFLTYSHVFQSLNLSKPTSNEEISTPSNKRMLFARTTSTASSACGSSSTLGHYQTTERSSVTAGQFGLRSLVAGEVTFASFVQMCAVVAPERMQLLSSTNASDRVALQNLPPAPRFVDLGSGLGKAVVMWALLFGTKPPPSHHGQHVNSSTTTFSYNNHHHQQYNHHQHQQPHQQLQ